MQTLDEITGLWHPGIFFRKTMSQAWGKSELAFRSMLASLRPQVSLFSGAMFVLVTLFLPIAHNSCAPNRTGAEFVRGASGDFPLIAGLSSENFGRAFYILALTFAAITLGVVLVSLIRPGTLRSRRTVTVLYAVAGTLALYLLADAVCWVLGGVFLGFSLEAATKSEAALWAAAFGLILIVLAVCLRSKLLRSSKLIFSLLAAGVIGCSLGVELYFLKLPAGFLPDFVFPGLLYFLAVLYWFVPVYLWYRLGLGRKADRPERWPGIRAAILRAYLPALAGVPLLFWVAWDEGVWGFIPFSIGIYLMALGAMRLAQNPADVGALESASEAASG